MLFLKVKELREKYKLTQAALAKSLGVSSITISAVETGRTKLSKHLSARIQEVYGEVVEPEIRKVKTAEKAAAKKTGGRNRRCGGQQDRKESQKSKEGEGRDPVSHGRRDHDGGYPQKDRRGRDRVCPR